ncbi:DMT family transporter [Teichococcus vastitatis]|uniref:DMT family transporter n=1 Tax=Teichococcus vastitatis TaxID=2307076 RepID=A0ABS9W227_9PROT|nr:DMT family transporter [Pseudoroseomonas vastitatis]MCI0752995.1 DMT family transporter [Pseudoroseomonas vastitatis]
MRSEPPIIDPAPRFGAGPALPGPNATRERMVGLCCAFGVVAVWSGFSLSARLAAQQSLTPWDVAALRYLGSLPVGLLLAFFVGWPRLSAGRSLALVAGAAFGFPLCAYLGFQFAPAAHGVVLLTGVLPFIAALLGALVLREPFPRRRWVSLGIVAAGILLLGLGTLDAAPGAWCGDLLFLLGSLSWAAFTILLRLWRVPAMAATVVLAVYPAFLYLPVWWFALPSTLGEASAAAILHQLVYQGLLAVVVAGFLFARAVNVLGSGQTTMVTALTPALTTFAAGPILGEWLGWVGFAGVATVSLGMVSGVIAPRGTPAGMVDAPARRG